MQSAETTYPGTAALALNLNVVFAWCRLLP